MKKTIGLLGLMGVAAFAQPANALSIQFDANGDTVPAYAQGIQTVEGFNELTATNAPLAATSGTLGAGTYTGSVGVFSQNVSNEATGPVPSEGNFLSILNGSYTLSLANIQVLSFLIGGLDGYNSITLTPTSGGSIVLNGLNIIGQGAPNAGLTSDNYGDTGRVTFDFGGQTFSSITFASTTAAFEIDGLVSAAPEPATWAMMILGFGLAGGALRRSRSEKLVATA